MKDAEIAALSQSISDFKSMSEKVVGTVAEHRSKTEVKPMCENRSTAWNDPATYVHLTQNIDHFPLSAIPLLTIVNSLLYKK